MATAILAFEPSGQGPARVTRYAGGYQDYVLQRARRSRRPPPVTAARAAQPPPPLPTPPPAPAARPKPGGLTYAERVELEGIVEAIDAAEKRVAEIEATLADPSLYATRGDEVVPLRARLAAAAAEATSLVASMGSAGREEGPTEVGGRWYWGGTHASA